mgnify:CR=1 FL=1
MAVVAKRSTMTFFSDASSHYSHRVRIVLAEKGVREVNLLGQNVNAYAGTTHEGEIIDLAELITYVAAIDGIDRIRFTTSHPVEFSDALIDVYAQVPELVSHLHLPVQSGSDRVLKLMKRGHEIASYKDKIARLREIRPDISISSDFIVGLPGETDEDFMETYEFLRDLDISYLHVFSYSERPNTTAVRMEGRVPNGIRTQRREMLQILSEKKRRAFYESQIGKTRKVLFEEKQKAGFLYGHSENYVSVKIPYDPAMVNELVDFKLKEIDTDGAVKGYEVAPGIVLK